VYNDSATLEPIKPAVCTTVWALCDWIASILLHHLKVPFAQLHLEKFPARLRIEINKIFAPSQRDLSE
jgi:hypothetical protein